jgi:two-component system, LytTR family, sensor histidine kinase AlgZ
MNGRGAAPGDDGQSAFLPDFCRPQAVLTVVLVAALLAVVLALARHATRGDFWVELTRTAVYLLWTGLLCAAVLCRARPWLVRRPRRASSLLALALIVVTVALVSESVYWFGRWWEGRTGLESGLFPSRRWTFLLPNLGIAAIVGALALRYFFVAHEWRRSVEAEAHSRIRALQARIRPHFLFNSLNAIASLTRSAPARAEEAIEDLADLFRVSLAESRTLVPLREELEVARLYQRMEQLRLGERLAVRWQVADLPPQALVPSLLLQPLLENAIGHGIEPLPEGGTVVVTGRLESGELVLEVVNPVSATARAVRSGNRMALDNVRERLELAFPGRAAVTVDDGAGQYRVTLRFPATADAVAASRW